MSSGPSTTNKRGEILPAIETILGTAKQSVSGLGIVGLEAAIGGVLSVVTALKNVRGNDENLRSFLDSVQRFNNTITYIRKVASQANQGTVALDLEERIASFVKDLEVLTAQAKKPLRAGLGQKFLMNKENTSIVNQLNTDLHRAIQEFMMKGGAATEAAVQAAFSVTRDDIRTVHTELSNEVAGVAEQAYRTQLGVQELSQDTRTWFASSVDERQRAEAAALNQQLCFLPRAQARYDSQSRQDAHGCLEGTRKKVLQAIQGWINSDDPESPPILWLCGLAGIGKSTIAHTIAEDADTDRRLGASFFFSRDEADRRNPQLVYPTIASQLARLDHELKKLVATAVENDHEVGSLVMKKQFEKLISEPLAAWRGAKGTIVIVMDALDECFPESGAEEILIRWAAELPKIPVPLKVLITSRPEFHIRERFKTLSLRRISQPYILHDIEKSVVREDIELFLRHRLNQIAEEHGIQTPWPSALALHELIERAGVLFIFAATAVKFIQSGKRRDPASRLAVLLDSRAPRRGSRHRALDTLYTRVLECAMRANEEDDDTDDEQTREAFRVVLAAIVLLQDPLSAKSLDSFLALADGTTRRVLAHLHSVLVVPESVDSDIRMLHPSFHDFITSAERCPDPSLHVDPKENHAHLAERCLRILLEELKRDPCNTGNPWLTNAEIPNLQERLQESISPQLRYASRYILAHVSLVTSDHGILADLVVEFCNLHLLAWIENRSLFDEIDNAILSLRGLHDWYKNVTDPQQETLELLHDANRMLMECGRAIKRSGGYVYTSILPFYSSCRLKQQYDHALHGDYIIYGTPEIFGPNHLTIEVPDGVSFLKYSPDGALIAAGTHAGGIYIFDSSTGAETVSFQEFDGKVTSIDFSPDGCRIAASVGHKVKLWDAITGTQLVIFEGHTRWIYAVAFASDGIQAITGSDDGTMGIWNSHTGHLLSYRSSNLRSYPWIALSPDKLTIASPALSGIEIWDWNHEHSLRTLAGHNIMNYQNGRAHFLPGNTQLIDSPDFSPSNPFPYTLVVWEYHTGTILKSIPMCGAIYVSPFGPQMIVINSKLQFWDTVTWHIGEEKISELSFPKGARLAFSPAGRTLVVSLCTRYLKVFDILAVSGAFDRRSDAEALLEVLAVSGNGSRAVGHNGPTYITLWDSDKLEVVTTKPIYSPVASGSVRFSSNSSLLAVLYLLNAPNPIISLQVLSTESLHPEASFNIQPLKGNFSWEMAFVEGDAHLLLVSEMGCHLWDINTASRLWTFDLDEGGTPGTLPYPHQLNHIILGEFNPPRVWRFSKSITVETFDFDRFVMVGMLDGQPLHLEIRDDMLWELDDSTERPLCWLPISWREVYPRVFSGPILAFSLKGFDIGVLNIDSLRRQCTSIRRARDTSNRIFIVE
ncbi:hypothetical protein FRC01_000466 [Tulasnella sp. 417]|nr:hypothetical protein FRC01_000466 [Tulasnella sp. 417]